MEGDPYNGAIQAGPLLSEPEGAKTGSLQQGTQVWCDIDESGDLSSGYWQRHRNSAGGPKLPSRPRL